MSQWARAGGLLALLAVTMLLVAGLVAQSILPGWEGLNTGVEGVTINNQFYKLGSSLPTGYSWGSTDPASVVIGADVNTVDTYGAVKAQCPQNPIIIIDPYTTGKTVDYWVKTSESNFMHVSGEIITYQMHLAVSALYQPSYTNPHTFMGEEWWFSLNSVVWDQALQEQSPIGDKGQSSYGQAWETYVAAIIQPESNIQSLGNHYYLDPPPSSGRQFTLYTSPQMVGTISDLTKTNLNATFAGDLHPDSRMTKTAYFAITMQDFGETTYITSSACPTANYYIKVYALRLGKFTYTNPDSTPWADEIPQGNGLDQLLRWLGTIGGNQFGWLFFNVFGIPVWVLIIALFLLLKGGIIG